MWRVWIGLLGALIACGGGAPDRMAECDDADCRRDWAVGRWAAAPSDVLDAVHEIRDPVELLALSRALGAAYPGQTGRLCDALPPGEAQQDCRNRNQRPHLQQLSVAEDGTAGVDPEESLHRLAPSGPFDSPWREARATDLDCDPKGRACQGSAAVERAGRGELEAAAGACNLITEATWRAECYFQAAEAGTRRPGAQGGAAVGLCLGASTFAGRCFTHVVRQIGTLSPRAGMADTSAWRTQAAAIDAAYQVVLSTDAQLAEDIRGQLWAYTLRFAYAQEETVSLAPLTALPTLAAPHVRAAAAWRLWALEGAEPRDLAAWQARLTRLSGEPTPAPAAPPQARPAGRWPDLWRVTYKGESALPRAFFLGPVYRAVSDDPSEDLLVCLLEAAARGQPPGRKLLTEALDEDTPLVRWTAARLLQAVDPNSPALKGRASETDPLVRARLDKRR